eukprot:scaffold421213_cov65-Attheya_sp.AAC.3
MHPSYYILRLLATRNCNIIHEWQIKSVPEWEWGLIVAASDGIGLFPFEALAGGGRSPPYPAAGSLLSLALDGIG